MSSSLTRPIATAAPGRNAQVPQIPQPVADIGALANVAQALKQGMDSLSGNRGDTKNRAVTFNDLINLGLVTGAAVASATGTTSLRNGTVQEITTSGGIHGGPITVSGELTVDWNAGTVTALGTHISLISGTLDAHGFITTVVAGAGLHGGGTGSSVTLTADWQAGPINALGRGLGTIASALYANWRLPVVDMLGDHLVINATKLDARAHYVVSGFTGDGALYPAQVLLGHRFPIAVTFPADFDTVAVGLVSLVGSFINGVGTPVLSIQRCLAADNPTVGANWTQIGTATFASAGHVATLDSSATAVTFAQDDWLRIVAPTPADSRLAQVVLSLVGTR